MTIICECQERRVLATVPPYTPWLLSIEEDNDMDLVLQVGGCSPQKLLGSDKLLLEYPQASKQDVYEAFSDVIDHVYTRLTERSNDIIDLKAAWEKVWPFDAEKTMADQSPVTTTCRACSSDYLWSNILEELKKKIGESTVLALFSSVTPCLTDGKLVLIEKSEFRKDTIRRAYLPVLHKCMRSKFNDDIEIHVI